MLPFVVELEAPVIWLRSYEFMLLRELSVDIRTASATEAIFETRCDLLSVDGDNGSDA